MNEDDEYPLNIGFYKIFTIALAVIVITIVLYVLFSPTKHKEPFLHIFALVTIICIFLLFLIAYLIEKQDKKYNR